jgi:hypothetical protein
MVPVENKHMSMLVATNIQPLTQVTMFYYRNLTYFVDLRLQPAMRARG